MRIIGISPLDKDSTVCLVIDGEVVSAVAEERLSRTKMHSGFPYLSLQYLLDSNGLTSNDIDVVTYAFEDWEDEVGMMRDCVKQHKELRERFSSSKLFSAMNKLPSFPSKKYGIPGLDESSLYVTKNPVYKLAYQALSTVKPLAEYYANKKMSAWLEKSSEDHKHWSEELAKGLKKFGLTDKLRRVDHHLTHAANAFYTSGFEDALIVTLDGYGSGLGGSISIGNSNGIERIHSMPYPVSLGEFYERVTSSLGFTPGRHEGKIVGLAAYEDPNVLFETVRSFFEVDNGDVYYHLPHNVAFSRLLATRYSKPAVAAAYQKVLEEVSCEYVAHFVKQTGMKNVVLSGGVVANVKANQRIFEIDNVENIFVHPNMGDGGCSVGGALVVAREKGAMVNKSINDVYWGQEFDDIEIKAALDKENMLGEYFEDVETEIARILAEGNIVARFNGRMEYGPRSLGNRSILYHAKDPTVNLWLNQKLQRTEFMPFAPATLYEERNQCYINMHGADYTSRFMTITFDCTEFMRKSCPAAVHIDGTARPQLVSEDSNPSFYKVLKEYHRLTGIPSLINTSFNMHEEPIVCSPADAIRAFTLGELPYLAIGSYVVKRDSSKAI